MNGVTVTRENHVPTPDVVVMIAVLVAGFAAASIAAPALWYVTPVVVAGLLIASRAGSARGSQPELPEELRATLADTLERLPTGEIRALYDDVINAALPAFGRRMRRLSDYHARDTRESVRELLEGASQVALDASRLDTILRSGTMLQRDPSVHAAAMRARAQYAYQLAESKSTLQALVASGLSHGTPESERLAELVTAIREETEARSEAWKEIDSLLSPQR